MHFYLTSFNLPIKVLMQLFNCRNCDEDHCCNELAYTAIFRFQRLSVGAGQLAKSQNKSRNNLNF